MKYKLLFLQMFMWEQVVPSGKLPEITVYIKLNRLWELGVIVGWKYFFENLADIKNIVIVNYLSAGAWSSFHTCW